MTDKRLLDEQFREDLEKQIMGAIVDASRVREGLVHIRSMETILALLSIAGEIASTAKWIKSEEDANALGVTLAQIIAHRRAGVEKLLEERGDAFTWSDEKRGKH